MLSANVRCDLCVQNTWQPVLEAPRSERSWRGDSRRLPGVGGAVHWKRSGAGLGALLGEGAWLRCLLRADPLPSPSNAQCFAHLSIGLWPWG